MSTSDLSEELSGILDRFQQELKTLFPRTEVTISADLLNQDECKIRGDVDRLEFSICGRFQNAERLRFYVIRQWMPFAKFLVEALNERPFPVLETSLWLDDTASKPGLVYSRLPHVRQAAVPDPVFIRSHGYQEFRDESEITFGVWNGRHKIVFWRGVSTGYRSVEKPDWRDLPRFRLCKLAETYQSPQSLDFGISGIVQIGNPSEIQEIEESRLLKAGVPQREFTKYRYAVDIDGNSNSWPGLFIKLLLGCTVIKVASQNSYSQWYYERLKPWHHFVPVSEDMSDLHEILTWVLEHDMEAFEIAKAGQELAQSITYEHELKQLPAAFGSSCGREV